LELLLAQGPTFPVVFILHKLEVTADGFSFLRVAGKIDFCSDGIAGGLHDGRLVRVPEVGSGVDGFDLTYVASNPTMVLRTIDAKENSVGQCSPAGVGRRTVRTARIFRKFCKLAQERVRLLVEPARRGCLLCAVRNVVVLARTKARGDATVCRHG